MCYSPKVCAVANGKKTTIKCLKHLKGNLFDQFKLFILVLGEVNPLAENVWLLITLRELEARLILQSNRNISQLQKNPYFPCI